MKDAREEQVLGEGKQKGKGEARSKMKIKIHEAKDIEDIRSKDTIKISEGGL